MPATPGLALPYPALSDAPNGPAAVQALADRIEALLSPSGASAAWAAYTAPLTGFASSATVARWKQIGKTIFVRVSLVSTTTTSAGFTVSLPVAAQGAVALDGIGSVVSRDVSSGVWWEGAVLLASSTTVQFVSSGSSTGWGASTPFGAPWAVGDTLQFQLCYEAA